MLKRTRVGIDSNIWQGSLIEAIDEFIRYGGYSDNCGEIDNYHYIGGERHRRTNIC